MKLLALIGYFCTLLGLSSCFFLSEDPVPYNLKIGLECKTNFEQFSKLLESNIEEDLLCLEQNLVQFSKLVRREDPDSISRKDLNDFIAYFFSDHAKTMSKVMSLAFKLNMVFLADASEKIKIKNLTPFIRILIDTNKTIIKLNSIIKGMDASNKTSWQLRKQFREITLSFTKKILKTIQTYVDLNKNPKLDIVSFLKDLTNSLEIPEIKDNVIFFISKLKILLVGGDEKNISTKEFILFVEKFPSFTQTIFDAYYVKTLLNNDEGLTQEQRKYHLILENIDNIEEIIDTRQLFRPIFHVSDLSRISKFFYPKTDLSVFRELIIKIKNRVIGGYDTVFTVKDIKKVISLIRLSYEELLFYDTNYDIHKRKLNKNRAIKTLPYKYHPNFKRIGHKRRKELHRDFVDKVKTFRYYRGKTGLSIYSDRIERNKMGLIEIFLIEKAFNYISPLAFEDPLPNSKYELGEEHIKKILNTFRPLLEKFGLWTKHPETFARNTLYLGDLFQNQSDGSRTLSKNEVVEYTSLVLSTTKIGGELFKELEKSCQLIAEGVDAAGFDLECYRGHYFSILLKKLKYKKNLPKLYHYVKTVSKKQSISFIEKVEGFSRDFNDPNIPMNQRDLTLLTGAILNIESAIVRFDFNKNNKLDPHELTKAFPIYKPSIVEIAELEEDRLKYAKSIFLYMIEKMKRPGWFDLLLFHTTNQGDDVVAKRLNIGTLLYYLVK